MKLGHIASACLVCISLAANSAGHEAQPSEQLISVMMPRHPDDPHAHAEFDFQNIARPEWAVSGVINSG
jgi:hypothetical protein